jgi:hypothetical protein
MPIFVSTTTDISKDPYNSEKDKDSKNNKGDKEGNGGNLLSLTLPILEGFYTSDSILISTTNLLSSPYTLLTPLLLYMITLLYLVQYRAGGNFYRLLLF